MAAEMTSYARLNSTHDFEETTTTLWDLYENAAKRRFGQSIKVLRRPWAAQQLDNLTFRVHVESADREPTETRKTIVDINTKEFTNLSEREVDESMIKIRKSAPESNITRYKFHTRTALLQGLEDQIGAQVMRLAITGGIISISMNTSRRYIASEYDDFEFGYSQEETIKVPPKSRANVTVKTYLKKYEQNYTLRFSIPTYLTLPVTYKTSCQQFFGCICGSSAGKVSAAQMFTGLPGFRQENGMTSFVQSGVLLWIGEGSTVLKEVTQLS